MPLPNYNNPAYRTRLLLIPSEALGHQLYLAPTAIWLGKDRQLSVSAFPLEYGRAWRDQIAAFLGPALAFEIRPYSAQTLFTFDLLLKDNCSTSALYSKSAASFVSARSLTLSLSCVGLGAAFSFNSVVGSLVAGFSVVSCAAS